MTDSERAAPAARLRFRLPGQWFALDPRDEAAARERSRDIARSVVGTADDAALTRRRVQSGLDEAAAAARAASADMLLLCREIAPGVPTPIALTVHAPERVRMTPAAGTNPDRVMDVFEESLRAIGEAGLDTAVRLRIPGSTILRLHAVTPQLIEEGGERAVQNRLTARYWYTEPGEKSLVLVNLTTPLGDIPHAMLRFFDSIVEASSWASAEPSAEASADSRPDGR